MIIDPRQTPVTRDRTEITAVAVAGEALIISPAGGRAVIGKARGQDGQ